MTLKVTSIDIRGERRAVSVTRCGDSFDQQRLAKQRIDFKLRTFRQVPSAPKSGEEAADRPDEGVDQHGNLRKTPSHPKAMANIEAIWKNG